MKGGGGEEGEGEGKWGGGEEGPAAQTCFLCDQLTDGMTRHTCCMYFCVACSPSHMMEWQSGLSSTGLLMVGSADYACPNNRLPNVSTAP